MKTQELRQKDVTELNATLTELLQEGFKLKMRHGSGQLTKHDLLSKNRRSIAQVKTLVREKELGIRL